MPGLAQRFQILSVRSRSCQNAVVALRRDLMRGDRARRRGVLGIGRPMLRRANSGQRGQLLVFRKLRQL